MKERISLLLYDNCFATQIKNEIVTKFSNDLKILLLFYPFYRIFSFLIKVLSLTPKSLVSQACDVVPMWVSSVGI